MIFQAGKGRKKNFKKEIRNPPLNNEKKEPITRRVNK
jgi:hypothetical protein